MQSHNPISHGCSKRLYSILKAFLLVGILSVTSSVFAQEICNNGVDDDGDGLIDLNDDECVCEGFGGTSNVSSLIPNSSFEDRSCCPNSYSQLNCADTWIQASTPTSDYWNTCGAAGSSYDGGTVLPPPDGTGFVGFINMSGWQEYVGACLTSTMTAGDNYQLDFWFGQTNNSPLIDLTFYGTPNCGDIPFSGNDCPMGQGGFVTLGSISVGGGSGWVQESFNFTPSIDINAIVIGGACGSGGARTYYYLDDLSLNSTDLWEVLAVNQVGLYCEDNIVLQATSDSVGGTWQWYKEGIALLGETAPNYNVPAGAPGLGNYTAVYTIGSQCEAKDIEVVQPDLPTADFTTANVCFPADVVFTDQSSVASGSITNYEWDFGDNNTSTQPSPTHTYQIDGTYTVELTVTTDISCVETHQMDVTVYAKPQADFSSVPGCLGDPTVFTDQSQINAPATITQYEWDFGDSNTSTQASPSNYYTIDSTYNVELITTSGDGCSDTTTAVIDVYPTPVVDVSVQAECTLDDVQFVNNSSISSGTIDQYDWDFGDNTTSTLAAPVHVYTAPNTYTVNFIATSDHSCVADTTFQLVSYPNPVADLTVTDVCAYDQVSITDNSYVIAPGTIDTYEYDPGDNSGVQSSVPSQYLYGAAGAYTIELIVTTQQGCDDTVQVVTNVYDVPTADFSFTNICEDDSVQFNDLSTIASGSINSWQWDFGNNQTSTQQIPPFQSYPADDLYPVSLIVASGYGCSDTLEDVIEIYPVPIADFTFDSVCYPLEIQLTDLSDPNGAYNIVTWQWTFNDPSNQTSSIQNPLMDFGAPGTYGATLQITNDPGCKNSVSLGDAVVHPLPVADFPDGLATCLEDTIFFTDESTITPITDDVIDTWTWDLDDSNFLYTQNGFYVYQDPNLYNVNLTVETNHGCMGDQTKVVEIYPLPNVDFSASPQEGCQPLQVQFYDGSSIPAPYSLASWEWTLGSDSSIANGPNPYMMYNPEIDPLDIAQFDISLTVTSAKGCVSDIYRPNYITVYPKPDALFSVDEQVKNIIKPEFIFTDQSSENVTLWDWSFGDGSTSTDQNPIYTYGDTGTYPIVLMVETQYGCLDTIDYKVKVEPFYTFYIPNSFTPDNDNINDDFYGQGQFYVSYEMWIYDRWGEQIFYSQTDDYHWDGTYKGKQVQEDTYIYRFYIIDWEGHDHQYKGIVTVHR
ncbi:MAG: PKD domain-containing protein [Flavobacteriales bacterium]|nr:PKD domain-containing protein [Flavobacteriales bacterium]